MIIFTTLSGFGIGWGKPAPMDPNKMKNPRWDFFIAVAAGPTSNILQAVIYAIFLRIAAPGPVLITPNSAPQVFIESVLVYGVIINIALALFNLIPIGPLDGQWLIGLLLPEKQRYEFWRFQRSIGIAGLVIVVLAINFLPSSIFLVPISTVFHFLTGKVLS